MWKSGQKSAGKYGNSDRDDCYISTPLFHIVLNWKGGVKDSSVGTKSIFFSHYLFAFLHKVETDDCGWSGRGAEHNQYVQHAAFPGTNSIITVIIIIIIVIITKSIAVMPHLQPHPIHRPRALFSELSYWLAFHIFD